METQRHELAGAMPGTARHWLSLHFGDRRSGRKVLIQCALHADEIPGLLVGFHLRRELQRLERLSALPGEVVLVPMANPIGLSQELLGSAVGRFELAGGRNFNRGYRHLTPALMKALQGRLGPDAPTNTRLIRQACMQALDDWTPGSELDSLQRGLQRLAIDADVVLDLHSDSQALIHLYAATPHASRARDLAQCLGASPVLLARESGDDPFDESVSRHWWELQEAWGATTPIELSCFASTIELRGERDVDHETAAQDAQGLIRFLVGTGDVVLGAHTGESPGLAHASSLVAPPCPVVVTPLEAVDAVTSTVVGVLVMLKRLGDAVKQGDVVAEVIDPLSAGVTPLRALTAGLLFAHTDRRLVRAGQRVAKIAGEQPIRSGKLLSP